jgi:hypothetical protein
MNMGVQKKKRTTSASSATSKNAYENVPFHCQRMKKMRFYPGELKSLNHIKSMIGVTAGVVVKEPGEILRLIGKAVRVRDLRPKLI